MMVRSSVPGRFLVALAIGCSDPEVTRPTEEEPYPPVPGCDEIDHAPCDVRDSDCQRRLFELAVCLRGGEEAQDPPGAVVLSEADYADRLSQDLEGAEAPDPNHFERALVLLGLVEPGAFSPETVVTETAENLLGAYRPETGEILVIDHGEIDDLDRSSLTLVHEYIHLLQDREVGISGVEEEHATSYDTFLATRAVIEGEARLHEARYQASLLGLDPAAVDWGKHFQAALEHAEAWVLEQPSPYTATWQTFPYEWGARLLYFAWEEDGLEGVLARFASPPGSTAVLMASRDGIADEVDTSEIEPPQPPEGWALFSESTLGAWGSFLLFAQSTTAEVAREPALGWRGDHLWVYASDDPDPVTAVVVRLEFASEDLAASARDLGARVPTGALRDGTRVVLFAADAPGVDLTWASE